MRVAVASGKGGAGKTSVAAALAATLAPACVVADCDVDAANMPIALAARQCSQEPYFAGPGFSIDASVCAGCGRCALSCHFDAIRFHADLTSYRIVPELCERCGACLEACPASAVLMKEKKAGRLFVSDTRLGIPLVHAELVPGEDTSGKLVRMVRERADLLASGGASVVIDAPPGIGCPVIASLSGCDLVVVVIEASASGIRDGQRLLALLATMKRRAIGIINKTGLSAAMDAKAGALLLAARIPLAGELPFDPALRSIEDSGITWAEQIGVLGDLVRSALAAIRNLINANR